MVVCRNRVIRLRFDDSLKTVLAADASTPFGAQAAFRQIADLAARGRIETARRQVAALVGGSADRVVFTGGGTEANVTVLSPRQRVGAGMLDLDALLVGATEHPSVMAGGRFAPEAVQTIAVDREGVVRLDDLEPEASLARLAALLAEEQAEAPLVV